MLTENTRRLFAARACLQEQLPGFLRARRWFAAKAQLIRGIEIIDIVPVEADSEEAYILFVRMRYKEAAEETYCVPLIEVPAFSQIPMIASGEAAPHLQLTAENGDTTFAYEATASQSFLNLLLQAMRDNRSFVGHNSEVRAASNPMLEQLAPLAGGELPPSLMGVEQSNTSVVYGNRLVLKLFRRVEEGINPELEIGRYLTEKTGYRNVPLLAGHMEYRSHGGPPVTVGILQSFVPNQGDGWKYTLEAVGRYFERIPRNQAQQFSETSVQPIPAATEQSAPARAKQLIGGYLNAASLLGKRTAELHLALSKDSDDPAFAPEPYSPPYQREFCKRALQLLRNNFRLLRLRIGSLAPEIQNQAQQILNREPELEAHFRSFEDCLLTAQRTRIHGDYHLGQVLVRDDDFVIIDFEGEPARPLAERRGKQSPLQDVAGMLRSFQYAAFAPLLGTEPRPSWQPFEWFALWARFWQMWVSTAFFEAYLATARSASYLPRDGQELKTILEIHLLEKAIYELGYELNHRPSWVRIPLSGISQLLASD